jgi:hypothetical protein
VFKEWGQDRVGIRLERVYDSATTSTICAKTFITYIRVTVPPPNVIAADEFGNVTYIAHIMQQNRRQSHTHRRPFSSSILASSTHKLKILEL